MSKAPAKPLIIALHKTQGFRGLPILITYNGDGVRVKWCGKSAPPFQR